MPLYDYHCDPCDHTWEVLQRLADLPLGAGCPRCGATARRLLPRPHIVADTFPAPYDDIGLGVRIDSRSQRRRIMRDKGLEELGSTTKHGAKGTVFSFPGQPTTSVPPSGAYVKRGA